MDRNEETQFPTKKDFWYCMIIAALVILFILSHFIGNTKDLIDKLGFSGTIISIVLAVIAIIYTFYQNNIYANTSDKLANSADKIQNVVDTLGSVSEYLSGFEHRFSSLEESQQNVSALIENFAYSNAMLQTTDKKHVADTHVFPFNAEQTLEMLNCSSIYVTLSLYYLYKVSETGRTNDFEEFCKWIYSHLEEESANYNIYLGFMIATIMIFSSVGGFQYTWQETNEVNIENFNDVLKQALSSYIEDFNSNNTVEKYKNSFKLIDKFVRQ